MPDTPTPVAPIPDHLSQWIRANAGDVVVALDYLRSDPATLVTILVLGRMRDPEAYSIVRGTAEEDRMMAPHRQRVREWIDSAALGFCPDCLGSVLGMPGEARCDWPLRHDCAETPREATRAPRSATKPPYQPSTTDRPPAATQPQSQRRRSFR